jgi:hypothetical protein
LPLVSCNLESLPSDELPSFDKLYAVSENVEAVDFISKPDGSGYLIIGNVKSNENSDIVVIDVGQDGLQRNLNRIRTSEFDEAVAMELFETDNSIMILGHRSADRAQESIDENIILKCNLDGVPIRANNAETRDTVAAEIKFLKAQDGNPLITLNDFLISPPNLIGIGSMRQAPNGNTSKITQIFNLNSIDFNDHNDSTILEFRQKPDQKNFNDSQNLKIIKGNNPSAVYEVVGQSFNENPDGNENGPSLNIMWEIYTSLESGTGEPIFIGTDRNETFGDILFHSNGKNYIAGNYDDSDSVFLISKDYTGFNNNRGQSIYVFTGLGNRATSLTEDTEGNIIMATIEENDLNSNTSSYLLKFSQAGLPINGSELEFRSTGPNNSIVKMESEDGNTLVILSQKTFDNNSTAIGLMKIKF